jgi:hypothetical protein
MLNRGAGPPIPPGTAGPRSPRWSSWRSPLVLWHLRSSCRCHVHQGERFTAVYAAPSLPMLLTSRQGMQPSHLPARGGTSRIVAFTSLINDRVRHCVKQYLNGDSGLILLHGTDVFTGHSRTLHKAMAISPWRLVTFDIRYPAFRRHRFCVHISPYTVHTLRERTPAGAALPAASSRRDLGSAGRALDDRAPPGAPNGMPRGLGNSSGTAAYQRYKNSAPPTTTRP